ncbi:MAG: hypothetical protein KAT68_19630, partial [Bacteroidales bacterium]|nr:hypothetical protein [Bacteroidales bacterium]
IEKYCYDDNESNCDEYGGLYQWYEMIKYIHVPIQGTQGICPDGWHIPTDSEWKILEGIVDSQYGVGDPEWDGLGARGFDAGLNLKSTNGWYGGGNGTDLYGFTVFPVGYRNVSGYFDLFSRVSSFWTSSNISGSDMWDRELTYNTDGVIRCNVNKTNGLSVRCLKD